MGTTWASDRENEGDEHYIRTPKDKPRTDASGLVGGSAPLSSAKHIASLNKSPSMYLDSIVAILAILRVFCVCFDKGKNLEKFHDFRGFRFVFL